MKIKKITAIILAVFSLLILYPKNALAKSEFLEIIGENAVFYLDEELSEGLFTLPKGYFLTLEGESEKSYKVAYAENADGYLKITGFVKKSDGKLSDGIAPYFPKISVKARSTAVFYEDGELTVERCAIMPKQTVLIYGEGLKENCYFALFNRELGYVKGDALEEFAIPPHPKDVAIPTAPPTTEPNEPTFSQIEISDTVKYILILFLILPIALFTFLLFSLKKKG